MKGELLKSVRTKSRYRLADIAVTRRGGLVYADYNDSSINLVNGTQIQTLITQRGWFLRAWTPLGVCAVRPKWTSLLSWKRMMIIVIVIVMKVMMVNTQKSCVTLAAPRNKAFNGTTKVIR